MSRSVSSTSIHFLDLSRAVLTLGFLLVASQLAACGDADRLEGKESVPQENAKRFPEALAWGACPEGYLGECAKLRVPIDWLDIESESLELLVSRRAAKDPANARGSFWYLDGGPGSNAHDMVKSLDTVWSETLASYNLYTIVHRGTFNSNLLVCPAAGAKDSPGGEAMVPEEAQTCVNELKGQWGDKLLNFRVTHAARDLAHAIRKTRVGEEQVFLYGHSYGSLLAQRFAQVAPAEVQGIILDGVLPPKGISYFNYDKQFDGVARRIAEQCAQDEFCASKWGSNPWEKLVALKERVANGHCQQLEMSPSQLSQFTARLLGGSPMREDVFALLYRVDRCDANDVTVVKHYAKTLADLQKKGMESWDRRRFSIPLFYTILFTEVMGGGLLEIPTLQEVEQACEDAVFCPGYSTGARKSFEHWPRYTPDEYYGKVPEFDVPVLAMNGSYDPATPVETAKLVSEYFDGPAQQFVEIPYAPHQLWVNARVKTQGRLNCTGQMVRSFLSSPGDAVETSCLQDLIAPDFKGLAKRNETFFGTADAWEGTVKKSEWRMSRPTPNWDALILGLDRGR